MSALPNEVELELRAVHNQGGADLCTQLSIRPCDYTCRAMEGLRAAARIGRASLHPVASEERPRPKAITSPTRGDLVVVLCNGELARARLTAVDKFAIWYELL